jgi:sugar phosphate isomerase/epimerase
MKSLLRKCLAVAAALACVASAAAHDLKLGVQTWTLRNLSFDQVVEFCVKHEIKNLQLIPDHIGLSKGKDEWQKKKDALDKAGLTAYTFGVAGSSMKEEENRKLFDCAKFFGMKLIVVEPGDFRILDNLEKLAKEYDIKVCIHNHGIHSMYGNPVVVRSVLARLDPKYVGVCMDAGWVASARLDPSKVFKEYNGRVFDIHLKDKKVTGGDKGDSATDTFVGEGDAKLANLLKTLQETKWDGVVAIETDNNLKDPTEHVTKAIEFFKANTKDAAK